MKTSTFRSNALKFAFAALIPALFIVPACKMSQTSLQVLEPADVTLPAHIQKFILADRTRPEKGNGQQALNILEGILTGEGLFQDKWASEDCIEGLRQKLTMTPRFTVTVAALDTALKGTGRRQTKPPLDWATVSKLLGGDTTAALVVLEAFDSNTNLFNDITQVAQKQADGTTINVPQYNAHGKITVYTVWRTYDLKTKTIVDQFNTETVQQFDGSGKTLAEAESRLPARNDMTSRAGVYAGQEYGHRISPQYVWVSREYYRKGNAEMKTAGKMARYNNWKMASEIWNKQSTSSDRKIASRASMNMALAAEQTGDIDLAIQWCERAVQMGDKHAMRYLQVLQMRKWQNDKLNEQMKGKQ
jgi:hypothetical protein